MVAKESPAARKILSQLSTIRSDALFDEIEAERLWDERRIKLLQERPTENRNLSRKGQPKLREAEEKNRNEDETYEESVEKAVSELSDEEFLGDMFQTVDGLDYPIPQQLVSRERMILRDFGEPLGVHPRKVLEEFFKTR